MTVDVSEPDPTDIDGVAEILQGASEVYGHESRMLVALHLQIGEQQNQT